MNNATITITTDRKIKQEAQEAAETLGTSVERLFLEYLLEFIEAKKDVPESIKAIVVISTNTNAVFKTTINTIRKNQKEVKSSPSFKSAKDAIDLPDYYIEVRTHLSLARTHWILNR